MAIITLSREMGSPGKDIARTLEKELDLNYLDKESLDLMLTDYGITEAEVEKYDEKKPSFWTIFFSERNRYLHFLKTAVYSFARKHRRPGRAGALSKCTGCSKSKGYRFTGTETGKDKTEVWLRRSAG